MATLETLNFDNLILKSVPVDDSDYKSIRQITGACFTIANPTPVDKPEIVAYSISAMQLIDLTESELQRHEFVDYFSGNILLPGSQPSAHCYSGHQYGVFSGQLGDGAVMYLGEIVNKYGKRWELQLKGCGQTPFSRLGDGRKALRSSIREFLCSEAMHHLKIPTTRAGACITSNTMIDRDVFSEGKTKKEKATIVTRIAPTFLRFGSFEICLSKTSEFAKDGPSVGRHDILIQLLEFVIQTHFPELQTEHANDSNKKYILFFKKVMMSTAKLVASWQCVGFCHGMLNTDNMSILGLTIDYGPFSFMDYFDPDFVSNSTDFSCRCTAIKQPEICHWNLIKLAEALQPCLSSDSSFKSELDLYWDTYNTHYMDLMRQKFGLFKSLDSDRNLFDEFLQLLQICGGDFTNCFRCLSLVSLPGSPDHVMSIALVVEKLVSNFASSERMKRRLEDSLDKTEIEFLMSLYKSQPEVLKDMKKSAEFLQELREMTPASKRKKDQIRCTKWVAEYVKRLQIEVRGIKDVITLNKKRINLMNSINPRNYLAENAIQKAENGDYSEVNNLLNLLENPYSDATDIYIKDLKYSSQTDPISSTSKHTLPKYDDLPPDWAYDIRIT